MRPEIAVTRIMALVVLVLGLAQCTKSSRTSCESDGDCTSLELCIANVCTLADCRTDGNCDAGQECVDFLCMDIQACLTDADCDGERPVCDPDTRRCVPCVPRCSGKCCGDDGCGGECADRCKATGQTCNPTTCLCEGECVPDCADKECGSDGCEGTCLPGCGEGEVCNAEGKCVCVPDCSGIECGPNGCGGECAPGCTGSNTCNAAGTCVACTPECGERECGPDPVCQTSCGECQPGETCGLDGMCSSGCEMGQTRCTQEGYGFQVCGFEEELGENTFGWRIPCVAGDACLENSGTCDRSACLQTEVMFLLDRSSSMLSGDTWTWVVDGFLAEARLRQGGNAMGLRQFPADTACSVGTLLSMRADNYTSILAAITDPSTGSATPIEAALKGFAGEYGDPNDGQAVVLITDGDETCGTQQGAIEAASALWRVGVQVYVIAVTTTANKVFLDQLARAGGTGESTRVTTGEQMRTALAEILGDLDACDCGPDDRICEEETALVCGEDLLWDQTLCTFPYYCHAGECLCEPQCADKQCGDDMCGSDCGTCYGQDECIGGQCVCQPDCQGRECGSDGCAGDCGNCTNGEICSDGQCASSCGEGVTCFTDDFEDGDYDGWTVNSGSYTRTVASIGANGTDRSLTMVGGSSSHYNGVKADLNYLQPSYISFWVRSESTSASDGYFVIGADTMNNGIIWFYMNGDGDMVLAFGSDVPAEGATPYQANTWYHIEFTNIDWDSRTYDFYIDGVKRAGDVDFRDPNATSVSRLELYNFAYSRAWWDEIWIEE